MQLNKGALLYGIIAGLIYCILSTACWSAGIDTYASFLIWYTWLPVIFILTLIACFNYRKQNGGYITLKEALKFAFIIYITYEIIYAIYFFILYQFIDPTLNDKVLKATIEKTKSFMEKMGSSDDQINDAIKRIQEGKSTSVAQQVFLGFGFAIIYDFIKALIVALIVKRDKKFEEPFKI